MRKKFSKKVGIFFAHVQNALDDGVCWGAKKLKNISQKKNTQQKEHAIFSATRKTAGFIGEVVTEYYREYEKLKTKK